MENKTPRIYTYKITFEEVPHYYYGSHKERKFGEYYMGSPETHKWMWDFYTPKKQVLELFDFSDDGYKEAGEVEKRLIGPVYNIDPLCLNENCSGVLSLDALRKGGKITGQSHKENGTGFFKLTEEERRENCKKGAQKVMENGSGIHKMSSEEKSIAGREGGKKGGKKSKENGTGLFKLTLDQRKEFGHKGGKKSYENGIGIFAITPEQKSINSKKGGKNTKSQKWQCTVTGYVSNAGALSRYQKARGINTSNRIRIQ
jgi:hypothetical protein